MGDNIKMNGSTGSSLFGVGGSSALRKKPIGNASGASVGGSGGFKKPAIPAPPAGYYNEPAAAVAPPQAVPQLSRKSQFASGGGNDNDGQQPMEPRGRLMVRAVNTLDEANHVKMRIPMTFFGSINDFAQNDSLATKTIPGQDILEHVRTCNPRLTTYNSKTQKEEPINENTKYVLKRVTQVAAQQSEFAPHQLAINVLGLPAKNMFSTRKTNNGEPTTWHSSFAYGNNADEMYACSDEHLKTLQNWHATMGSKASSTASAFASKTSKEDPFFHACEFRKDPNDGAQTVYVPLNILGYDVDHNPHPLVRALASSTARKFGENVFDEHDKYVASRDYSPSDLRTSGYMAVPMEYATLAKDVVEESCLDVPVRTFRDPFSVQLVRLDGEQMQSTANVVNVKDHNQPFKYTTVLELELVPARQTVEFEQ